ncbi:MAG: dihydrodipicolinate reductase [Desulfobacula sp.]|nr:dihydrodipicolinate reductase [Desulfobacula sp.]
MEKINVMVNGLPGNVAKKMALFAVSNDQYTIVPYSLTGQEITQNDITINKTTIELVRPDIRNEKINQIKTRIPNFIVIDYTHPTAVNSNAEFYTKNRIPFVMGTTGGDRDALEKAVQNCDTPSVIAPNMAKQIVGFQGMMEYAAQTFPDLFAGYKLTVVESHQQMKADTSGTAKAIVDCFNGLGVNFDVSEIKKIRDPEVQEKELNIPKEHLGGHGWHTYTLTAPDGSALFEFKHNINGRDIYVSGTFDAVRYLNEKLSDKENTKKLYTMIDVLNRT